MNLDHCPRCHVSLIGEPIPETYRPSFGGATHSRREILMKHMDREEMYYKCPDCGACWG